MKRFQVKALADFGVSTIKETRANGKRYVYHRASGTRLPDLPVGHPEFIRAFLAAEASHRNADVIASQRITPAPPPEIDITPPVIPDCIASRVDQIIAWVHSAEAGEVCHYHFGSLPLDQMASDIAAKRAYTKVLADFEVVRLRQHRIGENLNHYYAVRTDESLKHMPRNVLTGTVSADEYTAVLAITERQASLSVARVIRDALGLTDFRASQMRNDFIRRGWLTNGRPPELTERGLSVLI